jgi:hypothetical protein
MQEAGSMSSSVQCTVAVRAQTVTMMACRHSPAASDRVVLLLLLLLLYQA